MARAINSDKQVKRNMEGQDLLADNILLRSHDYFRDNL